MTFSILKPSLKVDISLLLLTDSMTGFCVHNLFNQFRVRARFHSNGKMWAKLGWEMSAYSAVCQCGDLFQENKNKIQHFLTISACSMSML